LDRQASFEKVVVTSSELQQYLHDHIPLSRAMEVSVVEVSREQVVLSAPLRPNINHRETVFGGSSSALAILAGWSLLHTRIRAEGLVSRLVIQRNSMTYDAPIRGTFEATSTLSGEAEWERFVRMFRRKGRARTAVTSTLTFDGRAVGRLEGEFVALGPGPSSSSSL